VLLAITQPVVGTAPLMHALTTN